MKTTCINLFGGPGCGKSTLAASVFSYLKTRGESVELVREYVKTWAWQGKKVEPSSQIVLLGKQVSYENILYGKVKYIVTDSPVLLAGIYALRHPNGKCDYVNEAALGYVRSHCDEVEYRNFFLKRVKEYDPRGRYETESEAKKMDRMIRKYLTDNNIVFREIEPTVEAVLNPLDSSLLFPQKQTDQTH